MKTFDELYDKAEIYRENDDWQNALPYFLEALKLKPHSPGATFCVGEALRHLGRYDEALPYLRRSLELKPDFAATYFEIAYVLNEQEKYQESLGAYNQCLAINPDDERAVYNKTALLSNLARLAWDKGDKESSYIYYEQNVEVCNKILKSDPQDLCTLSHLACAFSMLGEYAKALACYKKMAVCEPECFDKLNSENLKIILTNIEIEWPQIEQHYQDSFKLKGRELKTDNVHEYNFVESSAIYNKIRSELLLRINEVKQEQRIIRAELVIHEEKIEEHKKILDLSGATDLAHIKEVMLDLQENKPEQYLYAKAFMFNMVTYIMAYRSLSTGLIQADIGKVQTGTDAMIKMGVKKAGSILAEVATGLPLVGGIIKAADSIIDDVYNSIMQNKAVNKGKAMAGILQNKFDMESEICITIGKVAIALAEIRESEITAGKTRKCSDLSLRYIMGLLQDESN